MRTEQIFTLLLGRVRVRSAAVPSQSGLVHGSATYKIRRIYMKIRRNMKYEVYCVLFTVHQFP